MFSFAAPWAFPPASVAILVYRLAPPYREKSSSIRIPFFRHVAQAAGVEPKSESVIPPRARFQAATIALIWLLLVAAMARPEKLGEPLVIEKSARDVVLALDISGSMNQRTSRQRTALQSNDWPRLRMCCVNLLPNAKATGWL